MTTIIAYLWTPIVMALVAIGLGLLIERLARFPLPAALLGPVGGAAAIAVTTIVYLWHGDALAAAAAVVLPAAAGLVLSRRELRTRLRPGAAGVAALLGYGLYIGPSLLSGHWTWAGYNFVNDTSVNMIYADLLARRGFTDTGGPFSTTTLMLHSAFEQRYPMGAHGLIATLQPLSGLDAAQLYQPYIATLAAGTAAALAQLARHAGASARAAAVAGVLAGAANLTYQYGQHGAIKEIAVVMVIVTGAAVLATALDNGVRPGFGAVLALCLAAPVHVLSAGGALYAVAGAGLAVVAILAGPRRPPLRGLAAAAAVGAVTALAVTGPLVGDVLHYARGPATSFSGASGAAITPATFGHLIRPLPATQAAGVFLGQDYRLAIAPGTTATLQNALTALMLALAVLGLASQLWRRRLGAPYLLALCGLTAAYAAPRLAPYADAKLLVLLSPAVVLCAVLGVVWLAGLRPRAVRAGAAVLAAVVVGAVGVSAARAAHEVRLAPTDRLEALEDAADHAGKGYWLVNEWEEFSKYFMRSIRNLSGSESESPEEVVLREPRPIFGEYFDLDDQTLEFLHHFDGIVTRRNPVASLPPADFRRDYANDYYELWRRDRGLEVVEHLPLGSQYDPAGYPSCKEVRALARRATRNGHVLLAARRRPVPVLDVVSQQGRPLGWVPDRTRPGMVSLLTPGRLTGTLRGVPGARYRVWVQLSSGRPMQVSVDGRRVGSVHQVNSPEQWLEAGEVTLEEGDHSVELLRRGGRPLPGDGYNGELGPVALQPVGDEPPPVRVEPEDAARRLCSRPWDWVEAVAR